MTADLPPLAAALLARGIPVIRCTPCRGYGRPGVCLDGKKGKHREGTTELHTPYGWHAMTVEQAGATLEHFRPGRDTLAMVTGHGIDAVDLDAKDGADLSMLPKGMTRLGLTVTPSGGWHLPVVGTGRASGELALGSQRIGDYRGGRGDGHGRGLLYLPGSARPKYDGRDYDEAEPWDLDSLLLLDVPDPALVTWEALAPRLASGTGTVVLHPSYASLDEGGQAAADAEAAWTIAHWTALLAEAAGWAEGHRDPADHKKRGWRRLSLAWEWALACLVGRGGMTEQAAAEAYVAGLPDAFWGADGIAAEWDDGVVTRAVQSGLEAPSWGQTTEDFEVDDDYWDLLGLEPEKVEEAKAEAAAIGGRVTRMLTERKGKPLRWPGTTSLEDFYIKEMWTEADGCLLLRYWMGSTYEHRGTHWQKTPADHLEAVLLLLLENTQVKVKGKWRPVGGGTAANVTAMAKTVRLKTLLHAEQRAGFWFDCTTGRCPVGEHGRRYVSMSNGVLDLDTDEVFAHNSAFFNLFALSFPYDAEAECPTWEKALEQWFPGDPESQEALEEVMAWLILDGITLDKVIMLFGKPRAGKGTTCRLIEKMMGSGFSPMTMDDLADRFGMEDLIGLEVCHISEAASTRDTRKVVSIVKAISGRDYAGGTTVKIKGGKSVSAPITTKFVFSGNEDITLPDDSGVVILRLLLLNFAESFLGKEDATLEPNLHAELSGIFNRVRLAHDRLLTRGRFVQPASGLKTIARLSAKAAPAKTWFVDNFTVTGEETDQVEVEAVVSEFMDDLEVNSVTSARMKVGELLDAESEVRRERVNRQDEGGKARKVRVCVGLRRNCRDPGCREARKEKSNYCEQHA